MATPTFDGSPCPFRPHNQAVARHADEPVPVGADPEGMQYSNCPRCDSPVELEPGFDLGPNEWARCDCGWTYAS